MLLGKQEHMGVSSLSRAIIIEKSVDPGIN